ncbi:uncharacterized protein LOC127250159 [Andrographis paniculata]|uniref:uncharacterized protein LOC127250159 n=1 Tax=Andrographis paniculata TaxID=175694 RepID=UPI0021E87904|nr:uncharacterized protein LOC127250159 [Andrographis paniculata]
MRWAIHRLGFYWPKIFDDCIRFAKGCQECQRHGPLNHLPAMELQKMVKSWPFKVWALDVRGKVHPASSKQHSFIVVATDYFTKRVEAVPLNNTMQKEFNIKLPHSSPYYPQANGLAEAANKIVIGIIRKMVEGNPRKCHTLLYQALWAHRNSRNTSNEFSLYQLTFGQDVVLPAEFVVSSPRVGNTTANIDEAYAQGMWQQLEEVDTDRLNALDQVVRQSEIRAKYYGKRVSPKVFAEGDLVWKIIMPTYKKVDQLGKWSPNWESPFIIHRVIGTRAFIIVNQEGKLVLHPGGPLNQDDNNPIDLAFLEEAHLGLAMFLHQVTPFMDVVIQGLQLFLKTFEFFRLSGDLSRQRLSRLSEFVQRSLGKVEVLVDLLQGCLKTG